MKRPSTLGGGGPGRSMAATSTGVVGVFQPDSSAKDADWRYLVVVHDDATNTVERYYCDTIPPYHYDGMYLHERRMTGPTWSPHYCWQQIAWPAEVPQ